MPSEIDVELEVAPEPLQCVRSDAHDTGALYVHTILKLDTFYKGCGNLVVPPITYPAEDSKFKIGILDLLTFFHIKFYSDGNTLYLFFYLCL